MKDSFIAAFTSLSDVASSNNLPIFGNEFFTLHYRWHLSVRTHSQGRYKHTLVSDSKFVQAKTLSVSVRIQGTYLYIIIRPF